MLSVIVIPRYAVVIQECEQSIPILILSESFLVPGGHLNLEAGGFQRVLEFTLPEDEWQTTARRQASQRHGTTGMQLPGTA
jgi:hypothetical protein